jgi:hypothetical protein
MSLPPKPLIVSALDVPLIVSLPLVPFLIAIAPTP